MSKDDKNKDKDTKHHHHPVTVKKPQKSDWKVAVAFRNIVQDDSCQLKCVTQMACSEIAHTELMFRRPCPGKQKCIYRGEHYRLGDEKGAHRRGRLHTISYTAVKIEATKEREAIKRVIGSVDPDFRCDNGWTFIQIEATDRQIHASEAFVRSQLGCSYNTFGSLCNFVFCYFCPAGATYESLSPVADSETTGEPIFRKLPKRHASWFCSELVSAALIYSDVIQDEHMDPATTTPNAIFCWLKHHGKASILFTEDVYNDDDDDATT